MHAHLHNVRTRLRPQPRLLEDRVQTMLKDTAEFSPTWNFSLAGIFGALKQLADDGTSGVCMHVYVLMCVGSPFSTTRTR